MNYLKIILITLFLLFFEISMIADNVFTDSLLENIKYKYSQIEDYQADINVTVDVDFINIPEKSATIYFKQPDKIKYKSDGFILLPKKGINFSINDLLKFKYSTIHLGTDSIEDKILECVKVIPLSDSSEIIIATLWIDKKNLRICQLEANTKKSSSYKMNLYYSDEDIILPNKIEISFDLNHIEIPFGFLLESENDIFKNKNEERTSKGKVSIIYSNYKINFGIPDSFFKN